MLDRRGWASHPIPLENSSDGIPQRVQNLQGVFQDLAHRVPPAGLHHIHACVHCSALLLHFGCANGPEIWLISISVKYGFSIFMHQIMTLKEYPESPGYPNEHDD